MGQSLGDRLIGVFKLGVFTDNRHAHVAFGVLNAVVNVVPHGQIGARCRGDVKGIQNRLIETLRMIGQRRLIDRFEIIGRHHCLAADVTEQRNLLALFLRDRLFGAADQNIGRYADGLQFLNAVLGRFCLQLTTGGQIGQQGQMHKDALPARLVMGKLADCFKKRQTFDVADSAADFAEHEVNFVFANGKELFDFIGHMRHHLNGFAQIVTAAFLFQHVGIDAARGYGIGFAGGHAGEAFVMAQIEVCFGPVIGHEHFAMFKGRHRAGIDVQVGIKFAQPDRKSPRLQQRPQSRRCQTFAKAGNHTAGDEDISRHMS